MTPTEQRTFLNVTNTQMTLCKNCTKRKAIEHVSGLADGCLKGQTGGGGWMRAVIARWIRKNVGSTRHGRGLWVGLREWMVE